MPTFCGFDLQLEVERVLIRESSCVVCAGRDITMQLWLIVAATGNSDRQTWISAPVSDRAMRSLTNGRCTLKDALRHSLTGTAELVVTDHGHPLPDRCLRGADIPSSLLDWADRCLPTGSGLEPGPDLRELATIEPEVYELAAVEAGLWGGASVTATAPRRSGLRNADEVARGVAEGAVARSPRPRRRFLEHLGARRPDLLERGVEIVGAEDRRLQRPQRHE